MRWSGRGTWLLGRPEPIAAEPGGNRLTRLEAHWSIQFLLLTVFCFFNMPFKLFIVIFPDGAFFLMFLSLKEMASDSKALWLM